MGSTETQMAMSPDFRYIPLSYIHADSQASALRLILTLNPDWEGPGNEIKFVRFTDGITNTLLKIINVKPGLTEEEIDNEAVLMRAYGNGTEILIDRERETRSHALLASRGLAPPLLARFKNGLLYRFIRGRPCGHQDLVSPPIWRGVARRLAQWHAVLPRSVAAHVEGESVTEIAGSKDNDITVIQPRRAGPSMWAVLQKWVLALPVATPEQRARRLSLQAELQWVLDILDDGKGFGEDGLVFSHCDLLCANVIVLPSKNGAPTPEDGIAPVNFIDYEYAVPAPAAFDISNHLAEWGGYDCDYNMMPTKSVRRQFLTEYTKSYCQQLGLDASSQMVDQLYDDVDRFRGIPGLYWGVWALIQAQISRIDFDYASYAETRLGEYYAWKREVDGSRKQSGEEMPLRESRWASEV
ncbi:Choline/Ethanolamine kinase [Penicillium paradoxum]|uniref:Choline/Ethanolamine kinase n=1 Tax=Penicillium paradoxum TaxID=176176 RepID=UPI0025495A36|nr:Choline/Ethanolamine kinase [Penicillium paradoxum]KAJ5794067.1 Choline/Ethanolamine kinase [Penicillium paradoxum]